MLSVCLVCSVCSAGFPERFSIQIMLDLKLIRRGRVPISICSFSGLSSLSVIQSAYCTFATGFWSTSVLGGGGSVA